MIACSKCSGIRNLLMIMILIIFANKILVKNTFTRATIQLVHYVAVVDKVIINCSIVESGLKYFKIQRGGAKDYRKCCRHLRAVLFLYESTAAVLWELRRQRK